MGTKESASRQTKTAVREPGQYNVVMYNDDFTTMEFVVEVLVDIFRKSMPEAERIMMYVHENGKAVVGTYPYDIAVTKTNLAVGRARAEGFPFKIIVEAC